MCSRAMPFTTTDQPRQCLLCGESCNGMGSLQAHWDCHVGKSALDTRVLEHLRRRVASLTAVLGRVSKSSARESSLQDGGRPILFCYSAGVCLGEAKSLPDFHAGADTGSLSARGSFRPVSENDVFRKLLWRQKALRSGSVKAGPVPRPVKSWNAMMQDLKTARFESVKERRGRRFLCRTCQKPFHHAVLLYLHAANVHCQRKLLPALAGEKPGRACKSGRLGIQHAPWKFQCSVCRVRFPSAHLLSVHTRTHRVPPPKEVSCKLCCKSFSQQRALNGHMHLHSSRRNPRCDVCEQSFPSVRAYTLHQCMHATTRALECKWCKEQFTDRRSYHSHLRYHSKDRLYACTLCPKRFRQSAHLHTHLRWHRGERPYQCPYCERRFTQSGHLNEHKRLHTGERPYVCSYCGNAYHLSSSLHSHIRVHTGERPYQCSICTHSFSQSSSLKVHMRTHQGDKPYNCSQCGKGFVRSSALTIHLRVHTGERPYRCQQCGKTFAVSGSLRSHLRCHRKAGAHHCHSCGKTFRKFLSLRNHRC